MVSFRSTVLAVALSFGAIAQAQEQLWIDPQSVTEDTRKRWCDDQMRTCPFICEQTEPRTTIKNECWDDTLQYECICGNNKPANLTKYTLTLPFYICQEYGNQCVKNCGDNTCASKCREDHPCGATDPQRANSTLTSAGLEPTASSTETKDDKGTIVTGRPGSDNNDGGDGGSGAGALNAAGAYSLAVVIGGLFAGFALL